MSREDVKSLIKIIVPAALLLGIMCFGNGYVQNELLYYGFILPITWPIAAPLEIRVVAGVLLFIFFFSVIFHRHKNN